MKKYNTISDLSFKNKKVFLRLDLNTPLVNGAISDTTRIDKAIPTLECVLQQTSKVCIASHLGQPKGLKTKELSLAPIAIYLAKQLEKEVILVDNYDQEPVDLLLNHTRPQEIVLLENLRFYPQETANDSIFATKLAKGIDIYIDDAFGTMHRDHASITGIPKIMGANKCAIGLLVTQEVNNLQHLISSAESPYVVVLGGAKVSDKVETILQLIKRCNHLIFGGAMAYTIMHFLHQSVGASKIEDNKANFIKAIFDKAKAHNVQIHLPSDHVCVEKFDINSPVTTHSQIPSGLMGIDIGPQTIKKYTQIIASARTVFWNGPMGVFEWPQSNQGTNKIAQAIASCSAYSVVGGGHSICAIKEANLSSSINHISTGGGASLKFLEGNSLVGLTAIHNS